MRVLFIDIDTLRPDHMSCYGYNRKTTPNIDRISEEGVRFNNYYCPDAPCLPSRASLISGMFGIRHGAVGHGGTQADRNGIGDQRGFRNPIDEHNLHNIFRKRGYHTASISTFPERHSAWWFNAGLNETYNVGGGGVESGEEVLPIALDWIERNGHQDDWYLHVHLWDPHTPYRAPESFGDPFADEPLDTWITEEIFAEHLRHVGPHCINEINMYTDVENPKFPRHKGSAKNMEELKAVFDGYDTGILYADYLIGQILNTLRSKGIYDDTAIIVTSDHGENMGELGIYAEHGTADNITCHIPFIMKWPGGLEGHVDQGFHYNFDLLPTLSDLLDVDKSNYWDGESYANVISKGDDQSRDHLILSQMAHVCQRSARFGDHLYMRTYHDGFHLFDKEMLFNVKEDPHEQRNIRDEYPALCEKGAKLILDWHDEQMEKSPSLIDPLWKVMREHGPYHTWDALEGYIDRLEKTGREEGAIKLHEKYVKKQ